MKLLSNILTFLGIKKREHASRPASNSVPNAYQFRKPSTSPFLGKKSRKPLKHWIYLALRSQGRNGQIMTLLSGRKYKVFPDGSWRRLDRLEIAA